MDVDILEAREVTDAAIVSRVQGWLTAWADSIPNHGIRNFGSTVAIRQIEERYGHWIRSRALRETRSLKKGRRPQREAPGSPGREYTSVEIDLWGLPIANPKEYVDQRVPYELDDSVRIEKCETCAGVGHRDCSQCETAGSLECPECDGARRAVCGSCDGRRDRECSRCNGQGQRKCPTCNGSGEIPCGPFLGCGGKGINSKGERCNYCKGRGYNRCNECRDGFVPCSSCSGRGRTECRTCDGRGELNCARCSARGEIECPRCAGEGVVTCRSCGGIGAIALYQYVEADFRISSRVKSVLPATLPAPLRPADEVDIWLALGARSSFQLELPRIESAQLPRWADSRVSNAATLLLDAEDAPDDAQTRLLRQSLEVLSLQWLHVNYTHEDGRYDAWINAQSGEVFAPKNPIVDLVAHRLKAARLALYQRQIESVAKDTDAVLAIEPSNAEALDLRAAAWTSEALSSLRGGKWGKVHQLAQRLEQLHGQEVAAAQLRDAVSFQCKRISAVALVAVFGLWTATIPHAASSGFVTAAMAVLVVGVLTTTVGPTALTHFHPCASWITRRSWGLGLSSIGALCALAIVGGVLGQRPESAGHADNGPLAVRENGHRSEAPGGALRPGNLPHADELETATLRALFGDSIGSYNGAYVRTTKAEAGPWRVATVVQVHELMGSTKAIAFTELHEVDEEGNLQVGGGGVPKWLGAAVIETKDGKPQVIVPHRILHSDNGSTNYHAYSVERIADSRWAASVVLEWCRMGLCFYQLSLFTVDNRGITEALPKAIELSSLPPDATGHFGESRVVVDKSSEKGAMLLVEYYGRTQSLADIRRDHGLQPASPSSNRDAFHLRYEYDGRFFTLTGGEEGVAGLPMPPPVPGESYLDYRAELLASGNVPEIRRRPDDRSAEYWIRGFMEVIACSGTGMAYCSWEFRTPHGEIFRVTTQGEGHVETLTVAGIGRNSTAARKRSGGPNTQSVGDPSSSRVGTDVRAIAR